MENSMMDLIRVYGENFCQYPKLDEKLNPGLTCILGMNGSGKSNLVRALYLCLVGEVYGASNLVRDGHRKGFVALDVGTPQGEFTIMRKLTHNDKTKGTKIQHELTADWLDTSLSKKADVADFLAPFLAVTPQSLQYISFALQGDFGSLMNCDHMMRARIINTLMGMDRAEKLRIMLKDGMGIIADMPDRSDQIADTQRTVTTNRTNLRNSQSFLDKSKAQITDAIRDSYKQALVVMEKPLSTVKEVDLVKLGNQHTGLSATILKCQERIDRLQECISDAPEPNHADALLHNKWKNIKSSVKRYEDELDCILFPVDPGDLVRSRCTEKVRVVVQESRDRKTKLSDQVVAYGTGICGSCNQKLPSDVDIDKLRADLHEAIKKHTLLEDDYLEAHSTVNSYNVSKDQYDRNHRQVMSLLTQSKANLKERKDMSSFNEDEHKKQVEASSLNASHQKNKMDEQSMMDFHKSSLGKLDVEIATLKASDTTTPETQASAKSLIKAFESAEETVNQLNKEVELNKAYVTTSESRLETFQEDMRNGAANIATKELLTQARDKLHVEQLPRLAAQSSIQAINRAMKKYLDMFAFPYGFRLNEKLDFVVDFDSSIDHSAEILSGGEEVRAAMAMRFALMDVFSSGCGVLIIDEPTTALDKEAIGALIEVLETASTYFKSRNIKIICPTHDQQLAAISDSLITIGEVA